MSYLESLACGVMMVCWQNKLSLICLQHPLDYIIFSSYLVLCQKTQSSVFSKCHLAIHNRKGAKWESPTDQEVKLHRVL